METGLAIVIFFVLYFTGGHADLCASSYINSLKQEVIAGQFHVPNHPDVLKKFNINGNVLQRYFSHKKF